MFLEPNDRGSKTGAVLKVFTLPLREGRVETSQSSHFTFKSIPFTTPLMCTLSLLSFYEISCFTVPYQRGAHSR